MLRCAPAGPILLWPAQHCLHHEATLAQQLLAACVFGLTACLTATELATQALTRCTLRRLTTQRMCAPHSPISARRCRSRGGTHLCWRPSPSLVPGSSSLSPSLGCSTGCSVGVGGGCRRGRREDGVHRHMSVAPACRGIRGPGLPLGAACPAVQHRPGVKHTARTGARGYAVRQASSLLGFLACIAGGLPTNFWQFFGLNKPPGLLLPRPVQVNVAAEAALLLPS